MSSSEYGYNSKVADVIRPLGQGTVRKVQNGFRTIKNVEVTANSNVGRVNTRDVGSGTFRGVQQVRGQIQVVDNIGRKVMVMGYGKGKF